MVVAIGWETQAEFSLVSFPKSLLIFNTYSCIIIIVEEAIRKKERKTEIEK